MCERVKIIIKKFHDPIPLFPLLTTKETASIIQHN